jgi:hypothetical protein
MSGLELRERWQVGSAIYEHADFAVCEVRALNQVRAVLATFDDAEQAIRAAEELGKGYAACRRVRRANEVKPRELLTPEDLPIRLVSGSASVSGG